MKLTADQKESIKNELFAKVKNADTRSKIIATAYGYANDNGKDGDLESMVSYLMDNKDKIDELFNEYATSIPYTTEIETPNNKDKK